MSRWFRHYVGMCSDPKFGGIARRAKVPRDRVVFVFAFILEGAAEQNDGGVFQWDADAVADLLNCDTVEIERVYAELTAAFLIGNGSVMKWASRQYEDKTNAERQARYKEKKRAGNASVTEENCVSNAPHRTETDTDTEKKEGEARFASDAPEKPSISKKGTRLSPGWFPSSEDHSVAVATLNRQRADAEVAKFRDYWVAKAGKDGCKLDWDATWRNWVRRAAEGPAPKAGVAASGWKSPIVDRLAGLIWVEEGSEPWQDWLRARPGYVKSQLQERTENGATLVGAYLPAAAPALRGVSA